MAQKGAADLVVDRFAWIGIVPSLGACHVAGVIALRKPLKAEPADLFSMTGVPDLVPHRWEWPCSLKNTANLNTANLNGAGVTSVGVNQSPAN